MADLAVSVGLLLSPVGMAILGALVGSFLNVVIHRLPQLLERGWLADAAHYLQDEVAMRRVLGGVLGGVSGGALGGVSGATPALFPELARTGAAMADSLARLPQLGLARPRSRCPSCGHVLAWHENIPLLSWLRLRGKCSACSAPISLRYPIIEALTGALFAAVAWRFGATAATAVYATALGLLVAAAFIDLDTTLLPDQLTLPLVGLGLLAAWQGWIPVSLADATLGALFGYFSLWAIASLYKLLRGAEGMAEGDFKLLSGLGALLGWQALPSVVLLSSAVGAAVGIYMIAARGHQREVPIPFGPYLAGGGVAALFFGAQLSRLWLPGQ